MSGVRETRLLRSMWRGLETARWTLQPGTKLETADTDKRAPARAAPALDPNLHLIVEGDCRTSLSRGLQGLAVRMARALNRHWKRFGSVFADRFHDRILRMDTVVLERGATFPAITRPV